MVIIFAFINFYYMEFPPGLLHYVNITSLLFFSTNKILLNFYHLSLLESIH